MSHTRFALGFTRHRKVASLSDGAFRLWASAMDRAREQGTDGLLDGTDLDLIPKCPPVGPKRDALLAELVSAGLWETRGREWQIHDYLDWQDSSEQIRARQANARNRMRRVRANRVRTDSEPSAEPSSNAVDDVARTAQAVRSGTSYSSSSSGSESDPDPDPERARARGSDAEVLFSSVESDPGRETVCPLDLLRRPGVVSMIRELSERLPCPIASLQHEAEEFLSYWTLGEGIGRRRTNWPNVLRERLRKRFRSGDIKPPGAVEHESRNGAGKGYVPPDDGLRELIANIGRGVP